MRPIPTPSSRSWWSTSATACKPRDTLQLESAKLAVRAGSPQERILQRLKSTVAPTLQWEETAPSSADPVEDVESGRRAVRDHRRARVLVRASPVSERAGRLCAAGAAPGAVDGAARSARDCWRASMPSSTALPPRAAAADGAGILGRHAPASPTRSRASSRHTSATGCRSYRAWFEEAAAQSRHRLAAARGGRLPGVQVGSARGLRATARWAS